MRRCERPAEVANPPAGWTLTIPNCRLGDSKNEGNLGSQLLHLNASALEMELAVPRFVFTAPGSSLPRTTDCFGPPRLSDSSESGGGPSTSRLSPEAIASGIRELYRRNILRLFSNNF